MTPCWEWKGQHNADGYGVISSWDGRRMMRAHRAIYEMVLGTIPDDMILHHICANRSCVNPAHLILTTLEHHEDAAPSWQSAKTHCPQGHAYDEDNTGWVVRSTGQRSRICRACRREKSRLAREGVMP